MNSILNYWMFFTLLVWVSFIGCNGDRQDKVPDVGHISCDIDILRFDIDFSKIDSSNLTNSLKSYSEQYPSLFPIFTKNIVPLYNQDSIIFQKSILEYMKNPATKKLYDTVFIEYPDLDKIEREFESAFKFYLYYFPDFNFPNIYTLVSDFNYQNFIFDDGDRDGIGIGLDMFLGSSFPYKGIDPQNPSFSDYLTRSFNREHIVSKTISMLLVDELGPPPGVRLLDQMIHNGKKLYLLDKILPFQHDSIVIGYSGDQLDWVKANQIQIWSYFTDENLLYETNMSRINKYLNPAPSSPGMPPESPGMTANYIGWQIVKSYMNKFPETTIPDLIENQNSQDFLEMARYRPKNVN